MDRKKNTLLINCAIGSVLVFLASCARDLPPCEVVYIKRPKLYHVVQPGDSIQSIARHYKMSVSELARLNNFSIPYHIVPKQHILIRPQIDSEDREENAAKGPEQSDGIAVKPLPPIDPTSITPNTLGEEERPHDFDATSLDESEQVDDPDRYAIPSTLAHGKDSPLNLPSQPKIDAPTVSTSQLNWPVEGKIVQKFSKDRPGIDIAAPKGTQVHAIAPGIVKRAGVQIKGYGKIIMIHHNSKGKQLFSLYGYLDKISVKEGQIITQGQKIGTVGVWEGYPRLHLQIRNALKQAVEPESLLGR